MRIDINETVREIVRSELAQILPAMLTNPTEEWLDTQQVSDLTGMSKPFFEIGRSSQNPNQPPHYKIGRSVRYKRSEVQTWMESRRKKGGAQ